eukprot:2969848-Amphidinium_carterae.1
MAVPALTAKSARSSFTSSWLGVRYADFTFGTSRHSSKDFSFLGLKGGGHITLCIEPISMSNASVTKLKRTKGSKQASRRTPIR